MLRERWTGTVVGKMHIYGITRSDIAEELGVTDAYVSMLLNGIKKPKGARKKIEGALNRIIERQKGEDIETVTRQNA